MTIIQMTRGIRNMYIALIMAMILTIIFRIML